MTPPPLALLLAAAAALAGVAGLRGRARGPGSGSAGRRAQRAAAPPGWLRLLAAAPLPAVAARGAGRLDPAAAVAAAGLPPVPWRRLVVRARAGGLVVGVLIGLAGVALTGAPALAVLALPAGAALALAPDRWLRARAARRRDAVVRELPDLLDLLGICVHAGMPLDAALRLAADRLGGLLGAEVGRTLRDLALGTPRRAAYRELAARVGAPELAQVVAALLQAEELGAPLAHALAGQAGTLRAARRQAARDRAARAAPRIQLVVALLMVPAALLLVLGVMVIELAGQVTSIAGGAP